MCLGGRIQVFIRSQDDSENGASCALYAPMENESGHADVLLRPHREEIRVRKEPTLGIFEEMRECDCLSYFWYVDHLIFGMILHLLVDFQWMDFLMI